MPDNLINFYLKQVKFMYEIVEKIKIAPDIFHFEVSAPLVAEKFQAGQFIVLRPFDDSERIPLTIMKADKEAGTISLVVKAIGLSTKQLAVLNQGDSYCRFAWAAWASF